MKPRTKRFGKNRGRKYFPVGLGKPRIPTVVKVLVLGGLGFGAVWLIRRQSAFAEGPPRGSDSSSGGLFGSGDSGGETSSGGGSGGSTGGSTSRPPTAEGRALQLGLNRLTQELLPAAGGYARAFYTEDGQPGAVSLTQLGRLSLSAVVHTAWVPLRVDGIVGPLTEDRFRAVKDLFKAARYPRDWSVLSTDDEGDMLDQVAEAVDWCQTYQGYVREGANQSGYLEYLLLGRKWNQRPSPPDYSAF